MFEKRSNDRSPIELAASFGISEDPRPDREARVNNISSGGVCLTLSDKIGTGDKIQLAIELDAGEDVIVFAKVAWVKEDEHDGKHTVGVQFIEKEGPDYSRFLEFYNQQL